MWTLTPEVQCRLVHRNHVIWPTKITKFWRNGNDSKQPYYNVTRICIGYREPSNLQLTGLKECYIPTPNALVCKQYGWPRYFWLWIWRWQPIQEIPILYLKISRHQLEFWWSQIEFTIHYNALLSIKIYSCISLGLRITKNKIPGNIVERLLHINNVTSYEDFQFKMYIRRYLASCTL